MLPRLALVPGEPGGIGPELCVRLAHDTPIADLLAFADPDTLHAAAAAVGLPLRLVDANAAARRPGDLAVFPIAQAARTRFGHADPTNAPAVHAALAAATAACQRGDCAGMITGPVHKAALNAAGIAYTGTTELLAQWTGRKVVMMLARPGLRVALVTTHLPLRAVADAITPALLEQTLDILHHDLRTRFAIATPRIAVLGLNPHAGEDGYLGREEIEIIVPVLDTLRARGMHLLGPLPADSAFLPQHLRACDVVLAMYHDQGLPVLKHSGFAHGVNVTLGLPWPRVAVDHGTALDLAGRGVADPSSLRAATRLCAQLASAQAA